MFVSGVGDNLDSSRYKLLAAVDKKYPGKRFGVYRFLPVFFVLGAALEFSMINWRVGKTNFYDTFKRRKAKDLVEEKLQIIRAQNASS